MAVGGPRKVLSPLAAVLVKFTNFRSLCLLLHGFDLSLLKELIRLIANFQSVDDIFVESHCNLTKSAS